MQTHNFFYFFFSVSPHFASIHSLSPFSPYFPSLHPPPPHLTAWLGSGPSSPGQGKEAL